MQIHFPEEMTNQIQFNLQADGENFEQFIQEAVTNELQRRKANNNLKSFFDTLLPLESFADIDAVTYADDSRSTSRLLIKAAY